MARVLFAAVALVLGAATTDLRSFMRTRTRIHTDVGKRMGLGVTTK